MKEITPKIIFFVDYLSEYIMQLSNDFDLYYFIIIKYVKPRS